MSTETNRYTILDETIKTIAAERKAKKAECEQKIEAALAEYREYVNTDYKNARAEAFKTYHDSKVRGVKQDDVTPDISEIVEPEVAVEPEVVKQAPKKKAATKKSAKKSAA